jgi:hypothetical protein
VRSLNAILGQTLRVTVVALLIYLAACTNKDRLTENSNGCSHRS